MHANPSSDANKYQTRAQISRDPGQEEHDFRTSEQRRAASKMFRIENRV
jgi:hypothetical protein